MTLRLVEPVLAKSEAQVHFSAGQDFLAVRLSRLVGRERELVAIQQLLAEDSQVRLLTLTGPGGIGKTRLALAVVEKLAQAGEFLGNIFFLSLANLSEAGMVIPAIAHALALPQTGSEELAKQLKQHLAAKGPALLVLDNCETVVKAAPQLLELLVACPKLKIMTNSRRLLRVHEEYEFNVPPLALPPRNYNRFSQITPAELTNYSAIQFFVERVRLARPDFSLTPAAALPISQICQYLEGLPLALELAAPRLKMLSAEALLARLEQRLSLLTTGSQDVPARQRTMQASIEWSYSLLNEAQQTLLKRLSIFAGGWSLEAAEAICQSNIISTSAYELDNLVLDALSELVADSLVTVNPASDEPAGQVHYRLLEPIRQYVYEQLTNDMPPEELAALQRRHFEYYLELAQTTDMELYGPNQAKAVVRLEIDYPNVRAALNWALNTGETELALRLSSALSRYWTMRNQIEGQLWLEAALQKRTGEEPTESCANALFGLGNLVYIRSDFAKAQIYFEEVLELQRQSHNKRGIAQAMRGLAAVYSYQDKLAESITMQQESLLVYRELNDQTGMAGLLAGLGVNYLKQGDLAAAQQALEEAERLFTIMGNRRSAALALGNLATVEIEQNRLAEAKAHLLDSLDALREFGDSLMAAVMLDRLGNLALDEGDLGAAQQWLEESQALYQIQGSENGIISSRTDLARLRARQGNREKGLAILQEGLAYFQLHNLDERVIKTLQALAEVAIISKETDWAVILNAATEAQRNAYKMVLLPSLRTRQEQILDQAKVELGASRVNQLWHYGQTLSLEEAFNARESLTSLALKEAPAIVELPKTSQKPSGLIEELTPREVEVLRLVAEGLTNVAIAERLFLSKHTVSTHLHSIFSKLEASTRTAAVHLAKDLNII